MSKVALLVTVEVTPDDRPKLVELLSAHADRSMTLEPGCLRFDVVVSREAADKIYIHEVYTDDDAVAAHRSSDHMALNRERTAGLITTRTGARRQRLGALRPGALL